MNNTNNNTIDSVEYSFYNIGTGTYNAYFDGNNICCLSLIKTIKTKANKIKTLKLKNIEYKLNRNDSYSILSRVKDLKSKIIKISNQYYCDYNIILICEEK